MTYKELRDIDLKEKGSHAKERTKYMDFGNFAVCLCSNMAKAFLVDPDIARMISKRLWCIDGQGYVCSRLNGELIRLHDFVMSREQEEKPAGNYVDHINHDKMDNRRINLRIVSPKESAKNMPLNSANKSGATGVCKARNGRYRAYITINKKQKSLGTYATVSEAALAREEAERILGFQARPKTVSDAVCELEDLR